jgi:predicted alpha/beta hydrolase family esterase
LLFVRSNNDPYVPLSQAQFVANNCRAELVVLPGEGHFNLERSPDYNVFPKLLELLQQKQFIANNLNG